MDWRSKSRWAVVLLLVAVVSVPVAAKGKTKKKKESVAARSLSSYLERARAWALTTPQPTTGSLWVVTAPFARLTSDDRAQLPNDLITIHIVEQTLAQGSAALQSDRTFSFRSGLTAFLGPIGTRSLANLFSPSSSSPFDGQVQTTSNSRLQTSLTGHVVEVLPNGYLVVEAARYVEMNKEKQTVVIRGVIRPLDLRPDNSILSTQIANLEIELTGKGVISDGVRRPNKIIRGLQRILGF